jgi:hypothetical protein
MGMGMCMGLRPAMGMGMGMRARERASAQVIGGCLTGRIAGTKVDQTHKAKLIRMILATEGLAACHVVKVGQGVICEKEIEAVGLGPSRPSGRGRGLEGRINPLLSMPWWSVRHCHPVLECTEHGMLHGMRLRRRWFGVEGELLVLFAAQGSTGTVCPPTTGGASITTRSMRQCNLPSLPPLRASFPPAVPLPIPQRSATLPRGARRRYFLGYSMPEMRKVASSIGLTHIPAFLSARSRASSGPAHLVICVHGTPSSASSEALQSLCAPIAQHSARILLMQQIIVERVTPPATAARACAHARAFMVDLRGYSAPLSSARAMLASAMAEYRLLRQLLTGTA